MPSRCELLVLWWLLVWTGAGPVCACVCPSAHQLTASPGGCCVNLSGSALGLVHWGWVSNMSGVQVLDLSHCNISHIQQGAADTGPSGLSKLLLSHNLLRSVPSGLLSSLWSQDQDQSQDQSQDQDQDQNQDQSLITTVDLRHNLLTQLPVELLKSRRIQLHLEENPWDCSCVFVEEVRLHYSTNRSADRGALGNLTCASPPALSGREVLGVSVGEACSPHLLTPLFIALPLLFLSALLLCWCCGRTSGKEAPAFTSKKQHKRNGHKLISRAVPASDPTPPCVLPLQGLPLQASSALLSSTQDICPEGESLPRPGSLCSSLGEGLEREGLRGEGLRGESLEGEGLRGEALVEGELDTVSVTEVLRDSANREKAYLNQSTEYYSLVPGLQLEDSDHGEFDHVDHVDRT